MNPKSIAIIKLSSLGDIIHTIPAFNLLRTTFPDAKISWFTEPPGMPLLKNFKGIDYISVVDLKNIPFFNKISELKKISKKYRNKFDLVLDFQGLLKSSILSFIIGGKRFGFHKKNLKERLSGIFYTHKADYFDENSHVIKKNINLLKLLDIRDEKISYPLKHLSEGKVLIKFLKDHNLTDGNYVVVNIGAGWQSKLLTSGQYIEMINKLNSLFKIVILWGNKKEEIRADHIAKMTGAIKSPFLEFSDLILFLKKAEVVISSDSLPLHISDMVKTSIVGIYGPTSPERNGPLTPGNLILNNRFDCSDCYKRYCVHKKCLKDPDINKIKEYILSKN